MLCTDEFTITNTPSCIPCTKVRRSSVWSFKNHNIIYNKSRRTITNLRRELYTECALANTWLNKNTFIKIFYKRQAGR